MRSIAVILLSCSFAAAASAQTVTVKFNGDNKTRNYELVVDGISYFSNSADAAVSGTQRSLVLNNLQPGTHSLALYRLRNTTTGTTPVRSGSAMYTKDFVLRSEYDMNINVNGNGQIAFAESRIRNRGANRNRTITAMTTTDFNTLLQTVNSRSYQSSKLTTIRDAFNKSTNYFTTDQVRQLVSKITNENSKLELAKIAYARIVDPANIENLYSVFSYQSTRDNYDEYVTANINNNITNRNNSAVYNSGVNTGVNTNTRVAIGSYDFNQLLQNVTNASTQSAKYTAIYNAFNVNTYTYSSAQVRGLLALVSNEADRLYLAKLSYAKVSDPNYFSAVYDLFPSVNARADLNTYVVNNGGVNTNINDMYTRVAMSDASFNQILSNVQSVWFQSGKVAAVRDAFNTTSNIFSTTQIRQLLNLVTAETDRLALAKIAYARTADPANFTALYDLLPSQASRNDLDYYIKNNSNVVVSGSETVAVTAVTDAAFSAFMFDLKLRIFRSAKVAAVKDYINTAENYFSVDQVKQLVDVGSAEADKIAIAKLAYKKTIDRVNYSQVVALIPSANGKADLNAYITANQ